jgi:large subunit ribosomal protein L10
MKKKSDKQKDVQALRAELGNTYNVFVTSFEKLTVAQDFDLRKAVRGAGGKYRVVKNNLAEKAAEGTKAGALLKDLKGMTSLCYTAADPVALAKALTAYAKANPSFTFKAGMVEGRVIDVRAIGELANMPSKEELIAKLMWLINSSAQRIASATSGVARNLAIALNEAIKAGKFPE